MSQPTFDVTTTGETMVRLSVPAGQRLENATAFDIFPAGAEANLVNALSCLGRSTAWLGGLPANPLGKIVSNRLRMAGVNLDGVVWDPNGRMGNYFVEFAAPPRAIQVLYDRADSVAANLAWEQIDPDLLYDTRLLHLTGITPALTPNSLELTKQAIASAHERNVPISFDINYRGKLWSPTDARDTLLKLVDGIDLLFCAQGDAATLFNFTGEPEETIRQLANQTNTKTVVMSIGDRGVIAWDGTELLHAAALPVEVIDRIGAGDALAAGVIHGWLDDDLAQGLQYGVALAALALSQHGDMITTNQQELETVIQDASGGVNR